MAKKTRLLARGIKRSLQRLRNAPAPADVIRLTPDKPVVGRVLMSYSTRVYHDLRQGKELDRSHISAWQNYSISKKFLELGFEVDVFDFEDDQFRPARSYDIVFDIISNIGRIEDAQQAPLKKILFPMFSHWTEHNARSYLRHRALAERRGVAIAPKRLVTPNDSVERADNILCKGGEFSCSTYSYAGKPLTRVSQIRPHAIDDFIVRDIDRCRNTFVWIGGSSSVHKGLDLVLEAFSQRPNLNLIVVGNVPEERKFAAVYHEELFDCSNIDAVGWVDTLSDEFRRITSSAIALVAPSATELSCGSVIAGMMSGLIPVTTEGTDIDVDGIGLPIMNDSVEGVGRALDRFQERTSVELAELSRAAWEASRERYGKAQFLASMQAALCEVLDVERPPEWDKSADELKIPKISILKRP